MTENYDVLTTHVDQMNSIFTIKIAIRERNEVIQTLFYDAKEKMNVFLKNVDENFSPYNKNSLVSKFDAGSQEPLMRSKDFNDVYEQTVIAEQMTHHYFNANFNDHFDPSELVIGWAMDKAFDNYLKPLLKDTQVISVYINNLDDTRIMTKDGINYRWSLSIRKPDTHDYAANYCLQNGAVSSIETKDSRHSLISNKSCIQQATIISDNLTDARVWAIAGLAAGTKEFPKLISESHLTGMLIDKKLGNINFREGMLGDLLIRN